MVESAESSVKKMSSTVDMVSEESKELPEPAAQDASTPTVAPNSIGQIDQTLRLIRVLGEGKTSKVYLAEQTLNDGSTRQVAVKSLKFENDAQKTKALKYLKDELRPLIDMPGHDNIIRLYGICEAEGVHINRYGSMRPAIYAVQEPAVNGELFDFVALKPFDDNMIRIMARQMLLAVQHMRNNHFAHRDLKPENICVDENFNLKLIDFGFAKAYTDGQLVSTYYGSGSYMCPLIRA